MESIHLPHLEQQPLRVCLFKDAKNAAFLRQQLLDGNAEFEYAFLDASVLLSRNHVLAACFRAINDVNNDRMRSRNVHSEIVFALSPNNNIAEAFRRFGVSNESKNILAVKVGGDAAEIEAFLAQQVEGEAVPFSDEELKQMPDAGKLRKYYRIEAGRDEATFREAEAHLLATMALKGS